MEKAKEHNRIKQTTQKQQKQTNHKKQQNKARSYKQWLIKMGNGTAVTHSQHLKTKKEKQTQPKKKVCTNKNWQLRHKKPNINSQLVSLLAFQFVQCASSRLFLLWRTGATLLSDSVMHCDSRHGGENLGQEDAKLLLRH